VAQSQVKPEKGNRAELGARLTKDMERGRYTDAMVNDENTGYN